MNKKLLLTMLAAVFSTLFLAAVLFAGPAVQDTIKLDNKAYAKHTFSPVMFSHKKHVADYKAKCGDCHHDAKGKPLTNLKAGDKVKGCIECHKIPGKKPADVDAKKKLDYHAEAMHQKCIKCHQDANKKGKKAPVACNQCHVGGKLK